MNINKENKFYVLDKPPLFWCRLLLGMIFLLASVNKILHPADFARIVYNYQILPDVLVNLTAVFLPWVEIVLGFLLIFGLWMPGAIAISNFLLLTFFCSLIFNAARGLDIHCGCFSTSTKIFTSTTRQILRDIVFLVISFYLFLKIIVLSNDS